MVILQVYLAPKQSRNRPMITREYTHQCQNNLNRPKAYSTGGHNKRNIQSIQETKFKSVTTDIWFLTGAKSTSSNLTQQKSGF